MSFFKYNSIDGSGSEVHTGTQPSYERHVTPVFKFSGGCVAGFIFAFIFMFAFSEKVKVVHNAAHSIARNREIATVLKSIRSNSNKSRAEFTPYRCTKSATVFCCKEIPKGNANNTMTTSIKWHTSECDTFDDGFVCCYYNE